MIPGHEGDGVGLYQIECSPHARNGFGRSRCSTVLMRFVEMAQRKSRGLLRQTWTRKRKDKVR